MPTSAQAKHSIRITLRGSARGATEPLGVDRTGQGALRGFAVATKGPVPSHGIEFDDATIDAIVALGSKRAKGYRSRYGHPGMSSEAMGTQLGRVKAFRRDGDVVRADLEFLASAHKATRGDLAEEVMALAEEAPDLVGASMVVRGELQYRLEEDGTRATGEDGEALLPLYRPTELLAVDIVEEPAANDEMFGARFREGARAFFSPDVELSAAGWEFLDKFLTNPEAVESVLAFLERYGALRAEGDTEDTTMADSTNVAPEAKGGATPPAVDIEAERKAAREEALGAERARVKALRDAAFDGQGELLAQAIDEGWPVERGLAAFNRDMKTRLGARLETLREDPARELGAGAAAPPSRPREAPEPIKDGEVDDAALKARWDRLSASEREEFFDEFENYKGHAYSVARGFGTKRLAAL